MLALAIALAPAVGRADDLAEAGKLLKSGQHQRAMERVNKLLAGKPKDPQARFLKGLIYTEQGNTREAIDMSRKLTEDYPELPEPYNNLAVIYASQGHYEQARASLEQSIRTHPSYATAYENLGDVYAKLASEAYDKALKLDSSNSGAQNKLALVRNLVGGSPHAAMPATAIAAVEPTPNPPAKPAASKPTPKAPATASDDPLEAVRGWAQAWSRKDVEAYLGFYDKAFQTPGGESRSAERGSLSAAVEAWRQDWESRNADRYLAHYSPQFRAGSQDLAAWATHKRGVNAAKSWIQVKLAQVSMLRYPKQIDFVVVSFAQDYRSSNLSNTMRKLQYWQKESGRWRILYEGGA
ncbi:MAG: tetratricopeptide repeat protein [Proteobacteria bacterium]|nr:tetratricopeptide repeat protein [Pseudomonadota bacterium]